MKEEDIQYIFTILNNPELTETDAFKRWMEDEEHAELFWNVKAASDNLMLEEKTLPRLEEEWNVFCRHTGLADERPVRAAGIKRVFRWSIAAMFCLFAGYGIYYSVADRKQSVVLVQALQHPQEIVMQNDTASLPQQASNQTEHPVVYNTIQTPRGKVFELTLSDGTEIQLNAESTLRYPVQFNASERVVELSGEAYFKVAKSKHRPFVVKTSQMQTRVLGTEFNVRAYAGDKTCVTLVEGSVSVRQTENKEAALLQPGENATLSTGSAIEVQPVNIQQYTAWADGYFYFENASLENIMRELGHWYNVNVEFTDIRVMHYHFNFWADRNQDISQALGLLQQLGKVTFTFKNNTIAIDRQSRQ